MTTMTATTHNASREYIEIAIAESDSGEKTSMPLNVFRDYFDGLGWHLIAVVKRPKR